MKINELRQKRAKVITDARALLEAAEKREGGVTADDEAKFGDLMKDADEIRKQIEREERLEAEERDLRELATEPERPNPNGGKVEHRDHRGNPMTAEQYQRSMRAFENYLRNGTRGLTADEERALEAGSDTAGGFLVPSQEMSSRLIKTVDDMVFIRRLATNEQLPSAESLGIPTLTDPADFDWTTELATGSEDSTMAFGKRELRPHPLAKRIKVSRKLLRSSTRSAVDLVSERFTYKRSITEEKAFLTGNGNQRPLGVFTASADGISTSRDYSTDNTSSSMTADGLTGVKYTLKAAYWPRAQWVFHRDGVAQLAKLKDGEGRYLFNLDTNRLLGFPVNVSEHAPNTFTTGLYVGILGDFASGYLIVDSLGITIQRLDELYAETNQVGFIMRSETDGAPVLEEAFVRVKLG